MAILAWLASSKLARWVGIVALALGGIWLAWRRAKATGAEEERLAQEQATLKIKIHNLKGRRDAEADASRRSPSERAERVRRWQRPD